MSLQAINFDLKITPGSIPPVLHMSQYDSGRQYTAYLKDEENTAFIPGAGATAKLTGFNAAGVPWEQAATVDGSTVVFTPSGAATDQFGIMPVTIEITVGSEKLTPLLMIFDIQRAGYTNEQAVRSPEFETAVEAAVAEAFAMVGILLAANQDTKTAAMTQPVGVDANGKMWTTPGGSSGSNLLVVSLNSINVPDTSSSDIYSAWQAGYIIKLRSSIGIEYDLQHCTATTATFTTTINGTNAVIVDGYVIEGLTATHQVLNGYVKPSGGIPATDMTAAVQAALAAAVPTVVTLTGSTPVITEAQDNTVYKRLSEVTSLTVQSVASGASFSLKFISPAGTATVLIMPASVHMPSGFTVEPYGRCEVNVDEDGYATAMFWPFDE